MNVDFVNKYLTNIEWNNSNKNWQVKGLLKERLNQTLKFNINFPDSDGTRIRHNTDCDKTLFDVDDNWVLVDTKELISYMNKQRIKEIKIEEIINKLDWNIILKK